ncbi:S-adenosyl-L-methionine-dependent methyltransferase [Ascodesmis nigricans]|uniref:S-adenosyl-L-methionine-dependent methyltransferase n=1 Tax=Ascodesmis nigricans TaxID=341454 RepID=A0A4S2MRT8_9PEZI|nr:S-adenosyl-L-methionine-dependent methyltransferase [Ascodesmis nigricans]
MATNDDKSPEPTTEDFSPTLGAEASAPGAAVFDPQSNANIEADEAAFSDYGSSSEQSETTSVTSSVRAYIHQNGRTYHRYGGQGKYVLPNDEVEQDRLDLQHHLFLIILDVKLHTATLPENLHHVLDCGTGTGIWALEFGAQHPEAIITGVDLSPIQPNWVEPNVRFEVDDLEKEWSWPANHFQFIHSRAIMNGMRDFQHFIRQMYKHTSPGGVVEVSEMLQDLTSQDGTLVGSNIEKHMSIYHDCARKAGFKFPVYGEIEKALEEAGFEQIETKTYVMPWGPWPRNKRLRHIGHVMAAVCETGFEAYGLQLLTAYGGYTPEDAKALFANSMREMMSLKVHAFNLLVQISARKPVEA